MSVYGNIAKMIAASDSSWSHAVERGLAGLIVENRTAPFLEANGKPFINMCSCSYLGLDRHPLILQGALEGLQRAGSLHITTARPRVSSGLLEDTEAALSAHYGGTAISYVSCSTASNTFLPICASGVFTDGKRPMMIFDKYAHFSMNHTKPSCADESEVVTCPHNDLDFIEDICRRNPQAAYVADGTYSVGGVAPIADLQFLQNKYGLFLYLDDSHGLSVTGAQGAGYALTALGALNDRTVVVGSLAKAFGACGGVLVSGNPTVRQTLIRHGSSWSQYLNSAGLGAILASIDLHRTPELTLRQARWRQNLRLLDDRFESVNRYTTSPVRVLQLPSETTVMQIAAEVMEQGFYTSAVFFPIVPRGTAGLRVMPRADVTEDQMYDFCAALEQAIWRQNEASPIITAQPVLEG